MESAVCIRVMHLLTPTVAGNLQFVKDPPRASFWSPGSEPAQHSNFLLRSRPELLLQTGTLLVGWLTSSDLLVGSGDPVEIWTVYKCRFDDVGGLAFLPIYSPAKTRSEHV